MYCPMCFNDTLSLKRKGVIHLVINGKQMDAGRFLYNQEQEPPEKIINDFTKKIEEFFKWYSSFKNQKPITEMFIFSFDFSCHQGCKIPLSQRFSIIDVLIPREKISDILDKVALKYQLEIKLQDGL